ncbi:Uma2 family endonuclease [Streptomyces sp. NPDC017529]|uniref:Uma2 family endonuclease n=1 Tax=Streptomyces sp. NPDC017529 TaxID=3365000 RepID=UPI0037A88913
MTALAHEAPCGVDSEPTDQGALRPDLDEVLWRAWEAMKLPEGYHAEIVEGFIEVSPTGCHNHARTSNRLREELLLYLREQSSDYTVCNDMNVLHGRKVFIPDGLVAPRDDDEFLTDNGLGIDARGVPLVMEIVSPGHDSTTRDRVRKRRAYARAGIPVYVLVDAHNDGGTVTVFTSPVPDKADYRAEARVPYGTDVTIPEGPAKGFVIGEAITGPPRSG